MIPIPDKADFARYAESIRQTDNAVEVGVYNGEYAEQNLKAWRGNYYLVDSWGFRDDGTIDKNDKDSGTWDKIFSEAIERVSSADTRVFIDKGLSIERAKGYQDGFFDWVFLDAGHDYVNFTNDLIAWWPKVRKGGIFSGDDYGTWNDVGGLSAERYKNKCGGFAEIYKWGVIQALEEFCMLHCCELHVTWLNDKHQPAWYIIK